MSILQVCGEHLIDNSENLVEVQNVKDADGVIVTTATGSATIKDSDDVDVPGAGSPITLTHVGATPGTYRGTITDAAAWALGDRITIKATLTDAGVDRVWTGTFIVVERGT